MYPLSEQQIDYILNDIRRNGVEMEDLQLNLLDHICCIIEQNLEENGDFEDFYRKTVKQFYKHELREIEEETINLLTFKNFYAMKKVMISSGFISVIAFIIGSLFKVMHWPGAGILYVLAVVIFSFIFLPLVCILKVKETSVKRDKLLLVVGTLAGLLYCLSALFKVMHWPGANIMWFVTLAITFFVVLPPYFFTGIRRSETRVNTIVATTLIVALMSVQFLLTSIRPNTQGEMYTYLQSERLLQKMQPAIGEMSIANSEESQLIAEIQATCNQLKGMILQNSIGRTDIPSDFEHQQIYIKKDGLGPGFYKSDGKGRKLVEELKAKVARYNSIKKDERQKVPVENSILDDSFYYREFCSNLFVLNNITQLQLYFANAEQQIVASIN